MASSMEPSTEQIESFRTIGDIMEWAGFTLAGNPGDVGPTFLELLGVEATSPFVDLAAVTAADFNAAVGTWRTGAGPSAGTNTTLQQRGMAMRVGKAIRIACGVEISTAQVRSLIIEMMIRIYPWQEEIIEMMIRIYPWQEEIISQTCFI